MIAVSLNVGGGVRLIKPAKLYMYTHKDYKHNKHDMDGRTAPGVRGHGSVPLSRSGNVATRIELQQQQQQQFDSVSDVRRRRSTETGIATVPCTLVIAR